MELEGNQEDNSIKNFFGCYLLLCTNKRVQTYIGFTVDPNRRLKQHNLGKHRGGAQRTSGKGPWEMVLIVHGFPNEISALRFEWAWQHPLKSRRLRPLLPAKRQKETMLDFRLRVVCCMLNTGPWNRLPLTVRWLKQEYQRYFSQEPPTHMAVVYGSVTHTEQISKKPCGRRAAGPSPAEDQTVRPESPVPERVCAVCGARARRGADLLQCPRAECRVWSHTLCLARRFLTGSDHVLPVSGSCAACHAEVLWGELLRWRLGCYGEAGTQRQAGVEGQ